MSKSQRITLYSHLWPFYGGRQWHGVEEIAHFGWSVVSYYDGRQGFAIQSSHRSRDEAIDDLNEHFGWYSTQICEGLQVEQTEEPAPTEQIHVTRRSQHS
jgi:hypothetical protein